MGVIDLVGVIVGVLVRVGVRVGVDVGLAAAGVLVRVGVMVLVGVLVLVGVGVGQQSSTSPASTTVVLSRIPVNIPQCWVWMVQSIVKVYVAAAPGSQSRVKFGT